MTATRRLAAILAADVAGYSRLMGADEEGTLERLKALRRELLDPNIAEHHGRIVKTTGDGSAGGVWQRRRCGALRGRGAAGDGRAQYRRRGGQPHRIAHRHQSRRRDRRGRRPLWRRRQHRRAVEALADAGGVFVSNTVHDHVRDRLPFVFEDLGEQQVKNIARPVRVYRVRERRRRPQSPPAPSRKRGAGRAGAAALTSRRSRCCRSRT